MSDNQVLQPRSSRPTNR